MYSIRSPIGGRDRTYRDVAISVVGLLAVGFMLVEHGTISRVVVGVGVPLGFVVASSDRIGSLLALGWAAVPVQVTVTASIPARIRVWTKYALFGLLVVAPALVVVALFRPSLEAWHVLNVSFGTLVGITIAELVGV